MLRGTPSGSSALSSQHSEVILLLAPNSTQRSSRLPPTPSQNLSSGSVSTSTSSAGSVPNRCRSTTYGRQASSARV